MIENNVPTSEFNGLADEPEFNLREIISKYLRYWYLYILIMAACIIAARLYLRYSTPIYEVRSEIIIKDDKGGDLSAQNILSDLDIFSTKSNIDDEIEVLKTRFLMEKVVEELQLNVSYFQSGNIKTSELYNRSPFYVTMLAVNDSIKAQEFQINKNTDSSFRIVNDSMKIIHNFGDTITTPDLSMVIHRKTNYAFKEHNYFLHINLPQNVTDEYLDNVSITSVDKKSNVIAMTMNTPIPSKGEAILNKLYEVYTRVNREDKNRIADSTILFINDRLYKVSEELAEVEKDVEKFKQSNSISSDVKDQASLLLGNISDLDKQIIQQQVQIDVVESIEQHLKSNAFRVVPGALTIQDPTYLSMVEKYNSLVLERDNQLQTAKEGNPLILGLNEQIVNLKNDLLTSLDNIKRGTLIARNNLVNKNDLLQGQVRAAPSRERAFMEISRQQAVKQQLYLFLLQKREETAISKSGTLANSRLIDPAKSGQEPISPKGSVIYLFALISGFLIPTILIYVKNLLNNRIGGKDDIARLTMVPVFGELGHNTTGDTIIVKPDSRTMLAEQFRLMRTNLQFILKGKEHQVVMLTSSMSGEGKSFLCINLALSLAISGKKVLLMELDLRKPKVLKALGLRSQSGFSNYVVSDLPVTSIVQPTPLHPNLFVIGAGIIPPNPAELLLQQKVTFLFEYLRKEFDFVMVDTPPVGLVTDALLISKYTDANIYVVRQNYTLKGQLNIVNDLALNSKLSNLSILINDVNKGGGYGYGYGYGYGGARYYTDHPEKKSFLNRLIKRGK